MDDPPDARPTTQASVGFSVDTTLNVVPAMQGKAGQFVCAKVGWQQLYTKSQNVFKDRLNTK